jgi:phage tail protein X
MKANTIIALSMVLSANVALAELRIWYPDGTSLDRSTIVESTVGGFTTIYRADPGAALSGPALGEPSYTTRERLPDPYMDRPSPSLNGYTPNQIIYGR